MWQPDPVVHIAIADDHPIVIQGLKNLLEGMPCFLVTGTFTTGGRLLNYLEQHTVDLLLLDISLPDGSGILFCREIRKKYPAIKIIAISNLGERSIITQMMQNGASGYLLKTAAAKDILDCMHKALNDEIPVFSAEIGEIMAKPEPDTLPALPDLTKREKQILLLLASGKKSAEIAAELFISPLTVKTHRATLLQKFGVNNIVSLVNRAKEYRFI
ncbi:response regulator transcription factor [Niabella sp. CC-SYL272]|uniref:response regulator transcription factor n=1 Tax=Niabella agricola TaxID=2891571 RepID=UPI001F1EB576|nr:response regulator transcription factor [Niabella agricola]MCF3111529.1 response regulator transcription factor [Niabella agricola]